MIAILAPPGACTTMAHMTDDDADQIPESGSVVGLPRIRGGWIAVPDLALVINRDKRWIYTYTKRRERSDDPIPTARTRANTTFLPLRATLAWCQRRGVEPDWSRLPDSEPH
ncbi:hypothetical protein GCM10027521_02470 [Amycolatopsis cihanbeyliensis]